MPDSHTVVGLGEILWDLLPSGRQLGGAPANFAYCSHLLGENAVVASRVGDDQLGKDIRATLAKAGISDHFLQNDSLHPTGTVRVELDRAGMPKFEISEPVAWDFMQWTAEWQQLAKRTDAVCFGSLAQRGPESRRTIQQFLDSTPASALRIFDINLRQNFYSAETITQSLDRANVVKLNQEEVLRVRELLNLSGGGDAPFCHDLIARFDLKLACITRGAEGSLLCTHRAMHEHPGFRVEVKDTVGAGDAFTAALVHGLLEQRTLAKINDSANRLGAWVAMHSGAMPPPPKNGIEHATKTIS